MFRVHFGRFVLLVLCFLIISGADVHAQTPCGSIIEIYGTTRYESPIEDCTNPFGVVVENPNLKISYGTTQISKDGTYPFIGETSAFVLEGTHPEANFVILSLYKTIPEGYELINQDDNGNYSFPTPGTYTVVVNEDSLQLNQNFFQKLFASIVPTAYAFPGISAVITFTVTGVPEEPIGISNILFIPGIQASRLYTKVDGNEERLWEPGGNSDVARLAMNSDGTSIEDIYTKDVIEEKLGVAVGGNVYKGFLEYLKNIDGLFAGPIVETFPYDWRYNVFDIVENGTEVEGNAVKKPIDEIVFLAGISPTKKVTLIAHSNGGLLAKAIMLKLAEEGKTDLVDKVIFIASPHIGTPKGIAALLHGYDQRLGFGIIAEDEMVRNAIQNMPGVYGLLPSEAYISTLIEPMISFDDSRSTAIYRSKYGSTISNVGEYVDFLKGVEGREDAGDQINKIGATNGAMLESALAHHREQLDSWSAPSEVEVFNIVGTGLKTPKSIEYREFKESLCEGCPTASKLEPVLHFTNYGDETVVSRSAKEYQGENYLFFDLKSYNAEKTILFDYVHADIAETETVQNLIDHILHGSSTESIEYASTTEPTFSTNSDIYTIHSPARIYLRDMAGNITGRTAVGGVWRSEISESDYFEMGGVKYAIVPSNTSYEVVIEGEGSGVYTHELKTLQGDTETPQHSFTATATPTMVARYQKTGNIFSTITVDINGDGKIDAEMTQDGKIIDNDDEEDNEDDDGEDLCEQLEDVIHDLHLSSKYKKELLKLKYKNKHSCKEKKDKKESKVKEKKIFEDILKYINKYKKVKRITEIERQKITDLINKLVKQ